MSAAVLATIMIAFLAGFVAAQTKSASSIAVVTRSSATSSSATWPVVPIFLPIKVPEHLGASIVTAGPQQTVFAVDCMTKSACKYDKPFLLTGGESTFVATNTYLDQEGSADSPLTISCNLSGGVPAREATCTGSSVISGLGKVGSITTLASSEISYAPLTITAGAAKLNNVPTGVSSSSSSSSSGMAPEATAVVKWGVGGAAAAAALFAGAL